MRERVVANEIAWWKRNALPAWVRQRLFLRALNRLRTHGDRRIIWGRNIRLSGTNMAGQDLHDVHFDISDWKICDKFLTHVDFRGANLQGGDLGHGSLAGSDFTNADFRGAFLQEADFRGATLAGADITGATFAHLQGHVDKMVEEGRRPLTNEQLLEVKGWQTVTDLGLPALPELLKEVIPGQPELQGLVESLAEDWEGTLSEAITTARTLQDA